MTSADAASRVQFSLLKRLVERGATVGVILDTARAFAAAFAAERLRSEPSPLSRETVARVLKVAAEEGLTIEWPYMGQTKRREALDRMVARLTEKGDGNGGD